VVSCGRCNRTLATELASDALTTVLRRRQPKQPVIIHSDQGCQFGSNDFTRWCKNKRLILSMSRRGNCYDNAVAESIFKQFEKGVH
jgi:putative transposase